MGGTARTGGEEGIPPNPALSPPKMGRVGAPALQCWGGEGCSKSPFSAGVLGQPPHAGGTWGGLYVPRLPLPSPFHPGCLKTSPSEGLRGQDLALGCTQEEAWSQPRCLQHLGWASTARGPPSPSPVPVPPSPAVSTGAEGAARRPGRGVGEKTGLAPAASLPGQSKGRAQHGVGCFSFPKPQGGPEPRPPRHGGDKVPGASAAASLRRCAELCLAARMAASTPG